MRLKPCPHCDSNEVYEQHNVTANGDSGPSLLPGLGRWFHGAKMTVVVCHACGLIRLFGSPEARKKMSESEKWTRVT
jgi:hypothetical protein